MHFLQRSTHSSETELWSFKILFLGWRRNLSGASALRYWKVAMDALTEIGGTLLEHLPQSPDLALCDFWAFPTMQRELRSSSRSLRQTVRSTFSRSGWNVVRSASVAKRGTSKKRPSPHLHKARLGVIRWVHEFSKRPSYLEKAKVKQFGRYRYVGPCYHGMSRPRLQETVPRMGSICEYTE
jgi:hypothetical protein